MSNLFFLLSLLALLLLLVAGPTGVHSAGMSTHSTVGARALFWFDSESHPEYRELLESRKSWWQPGTFFPDFGYSCGYSEEAEAAHWPPFQNYTANFIRDHYPKPWSAEAQDTIAFLFGMMAHSVADNSWHSLGMYEGIIEAMQYTEFRGDWNAAHSKADTGGEFVLKYNVDLSGNAQLVWNIPTADLNAIFHQYLPSTAVSEQALQRCLLIGYAGIWANQILGDLALPYTRNSPLLNEEYESYFLGGLDDMAVWTSHCWSDLIRWLEEGGYIRPMCTLMENQWIGHAQPPTNPRHSQSDLTGEQALLALEKLGFAVRLTAHGRHTSFELYRPDGQDALTHLATLIEEARLAAATKEQDRKAEEQGTSSSSPMATCVYAASYGNSSTLTFNTETSYSQFGTSAIAGDFNGDGIEDLAVGAPGTGGPGESQIGAVYIIYGKRGLKPVVSQTQGILQAASLILRGDQIYSRFGYELTVVDLNRDGIDDLAISAPTYNGLEMWYDGRVYVYFGSSSGLTTTADLTITTQQPYPIVDPNNSHGFKFVLMGQVLSSGDVDADGFADLIIGSPLAAPHAEGHQRGLVSVFFSSSSHLRERDIYADADLEIPGSLDYQRFGSSVQVAVLPSGQRLLIVGSNFYGIDVDTQCVGRLYGYDVKDAATPLFTITGVEEFQKFGAPLVIGDFFGDNRTLAAVSGYSEKVGRTWQAGTVRVIDLEGLRGEVGFRLADFETTFQGGERDGHFGWALQATKTSLWISESFYGNFRADEKANTGRIYEYSLGANFPRGTIRDRVAAATTCITGSEVRGKFGQRVVSLDFDADGLQDLVVTSYHSSSGSFHSGAVAVFFG